MRILDEAIRLFAERGAAGTSLQEIADAAGLTRPAVYHYFKNKDELLSRLVDEVTMAPVNQLAGIGDRQGLLPVDRLREMAQVVAYHQASRPEHFKALLRSEAALSESLAASYHEGRRSVLGAFDAVIAEGVATGVFRAVDSRTAALGVIGLCNWVAWWHRPAGEAADRQVAEVLAEMAVASVMPAQRPPASPTDLIGAIALLRTDLALLEGLAQLPHG